MKEQKAYHTRKLAIIEMIEECDRRINDERVFLDRINKSNLYAFPVASYNISRYERVKKYLTERYNR